MRLLVNTHLAVFFVLLVIAVPSWSQQLEEIVIRDGFRPIENPCSGWNL